MALRLFLFLILTLALGSCGKSSEKEESSALSKAQGLLTLKKCDEAIELLEELGRNDDNPVYLQVLSSAYACRAGFENINFLSNDLKSIKADSANFMRSLSILSLSKEKEADSQAVKDLTEALRILLESNGSEPSQLARESKFGPIKAADMGIQAVFLSIVGLGKFLNFYGNVDIIGNKGEGAASSDEQGANPSECFIPYTDSSALLYLQTLPATNACNNYPTTNAHPNLSFSTDLVKTKSRLCGGLILVTNIIDILSNISLPDASFLDKVKEISTFSQALKDSIIQANPQLENLINTTSRESCEALMENNGEFNNMQLLYAVLFETGLP
jgi:hypothetical protein